MCFSTNSAMASAFCRCQEAHQRRKVSDVADLIASSAGRQAVPDVLVDGDLGHRGALVHARRVVVLPHRVQAEPEVLDAADPFRAVDGAALGGGQDLAARHVDHGHAHLGVELGHDAGLPALHALEVGEVLDRPLEPAHRLRARRDARERDEVELELLLVELVPELEPAAVVDPADEVDGIHAGDAGRRVGEQRRRLVLAEPPVRDAVGAIDHLLVGGVEDLERRHDRPARQRIDLELAAGQLVDPVGKELEGVLRRARRRHRRLDLERSDGCWASAGPANATVAETAATTAALVSAVMCIGVLLLSGAVGWAPCRSRSAVSLPRIRFFQPEGPFWAPVEVARPHAVTPRRQFPATRTDSGVR